MRTFGMEEILRTQDIVLIATIEPLLRAENIRYFVADQHLSVLEGSLGFLPRRLLVHAADARRARRFLVEAGFADELRPEKPHV